MSVHSHVGEGLHVGRRVDDDHVGAADHDAQLHEVQLARARSRRWPRGARRAGAHHGEVLVALVHLHGDGAPVDRLLPRRRAQRPPGWGRQAPAILRAVMAPAHLVEAVQDRRVAVPADAGDRRRAQVQAPVQVRCPQRPGHRRLDRADVTHHHHVAVVPPGPGAVGGEELLARRRHPLVHLGQRLATFGPEVAVGLPALPHLRRDAPQRLALELAVVDLDPALVDHHRRAEGEQVGRVPGPPQRARRTSATGVQQQPARRRGLGPAGVGQLDVGPAEQQALRVGHGLAVADQDQHGSGRHEHAAALLAGGHARRAAAPGSSPPRPTTARGGTRRSGCPPGAPRRCP